MTINREEFELFRDQVDWMVKNGLSFHQAMIMCGYAYSSDSNILKAYFHLNVYETADEKITKEDIKKKMKQG